MAACRSIPDCFQTIFDLRPPYNDSPDPKMVGIVAPSGAIYYDLLRCLNENWKAARGCVLLVQQAILIIQSQAGATSKPSSTYTGASQNYTRCWFWCFHVAFCSEMNDGELYL